MSYALFFIKTGELIKVYKTEAAARTGMRTSNRNAGWERLSRSWTNGYEMEWCRNTNGMFAPVHTYAHAPYGITEYGRWEKKLSPGAKARELMSADYE